MMLNFLLLVVISACFGVTFGNESLIEFNLNNGTWSLYSIKLEMYFKVHNTNEDLKLATMMLLIGDDANELLYNLVAPRELTELSYAEAKELLKQHFQPTPSDLAGRYTFRLRKQNTDENIRQYVKELQKLAEVCNFGSTLGVNLRDQFVFGLQSDAIRQQLILEDYRLTFPDAVKIALEAEDKGSKKKTEHALDSSELEENEGSQNDTQVCPGPNPEIPFTCLIPNGVRPGSVIRVRGSTPFSSARFSINYVCGSDITSIHDDIAFHIDFRYWNNNVVRNSMNASLPTNLERWSYWNEEVDSGTPIPKGKPFELVILCLEKYFKVTINDKHFTDFYHRIPIHRITNFLINGEVYVQSVSFEDICNSKET